MGGGGLGIIFDGWGLAGKYYRWVGVDAKIFLVDGGEWGLVYFLIMSD